MKNVILTIVLFITAPLSYGSLVWDTMWEANELPEAFQNGDVFAHTVGGSVGRWIEPDGLGGQKYRVQQQLGTAYSNYSTKSGYWTDADSTIEFKYVTQAYRDSKLQAMHFRIDSSALSHRTGFIFGKVPSGTQRIWDVATSSNYVDFNHIALTSYRVLYYATGVDAGKTALYYDNNGTWTHLLTANGFAVASATDRMLLGDPGTSAVASLYDVHNHYWTNETATLNTIIPEPATLGLLLAGMAFIAKKRIQQ